AFYERDAGRFHRDVRPGPHRDAYVGLRERRGVVDAVAGHRDDVAFTLQAHDDVPLVLRQHVGHDLVDTERAADGFGRPYVVARQHDDPDTGLAQRLERGWRGLLDRVGDAQQAREPAVDRDEDRRR